MERRIEYAEGRELEARDGGAVKFGGKETKAGATDERR
jgi:hypothetical protein